VMEVRGRRGGFRIDVSPWTRALFCASHGRGSIVSAAVGRLDLRQVAGYSIGLIAWWVEPCGRCDLAGHIFSIEHPSLVGNGEAIRV
jgi:hypothetical protein